MNTAEWLPGDVKPVRDGVYEARDEELDCSFFNWFYRGEWYYGNADVALADCRYVWHEGPSKWRGLSEKPA